MKNLFNRIISIICAVTLLICALSVCAAAEEESATPTDVQEENLTEEQPQDIPEDPQEEQESDPEQEQENEPAPEQEQTEIQGQTEEQEQEDEPEEGEETPDESSEGPVESIEILITKTMTVGESWEGVTGTSRLAVLKLDIHKAQTVHMIVEGKNAWANVQKSDRTEENLRKVQTDPETKRAIISWDAEAGSYLITIGPEEPNPMAKAKVTFLDDEAYAAWEEALEEANENPADNTEDAAEKENAVFTDEKQIDQIEEVNEPDTDQSGNRSIIVTLTWDSDFPLIGDTAHLKATLVGYEGLNYSLQWQGSPDNQKWTDVPGETKDGFDVVITPELNHYYWRIIAYVEDPEQQYTTD